MNKQYKDAMDSIRVSREWEDNMINKLMHTEEQPVRRLHAVRRTGLIAVAAALCLTIGAGAVEVTTGAVSDLFAPLLGTAHTEIVDKIGYPIGVSDTDNGVTVSADAIIGDENTVCVMYTLRKDDGSSWGITDDDMLLFEDSDLDLPVPARAIAEGWGSHGGSWFIDEDPTDNILQYVEQRTVDEGVAMGRAKQTMHNLCVWNEETGGTDTLVKGDWKLRFDVQFEDTTTRFDADQAIGFAGGEATVTDIRFSPISFRIEVQQDGADYEYSGDPRFLDGLSEAYSQLEVTLTLTDGTEISLGDFGGTVTQPENNDGTAIFVKSGIFDEVIPVEEMASVTVCGTEIALQ